MYNEWTNGESQFFSKKPWNKVTHKFLSLCVLVLAREIGSIRVIELSLAQNQFSTHVGLSFRKSLLTQWTKDMRCTYVCTEVFMFILISSFFLGSFSSHLFFIMTTSLLLRWTGRESRDKKTQVKLSVQRAFSCGTNNMAYRPEWITSFKPGCFMLGC